MDKKLLRKEMRSFRNSIDFTHEKNCKIRKKVLELFEEEKYTSVFSYISMKSEVDTKEIIFALLNKMQVFGPHTEKTGMFPVRFLGQMSLDKTDKLGNVYTNAIDESIVPQATITPLLAFDKNNYRLGYGGGYYDKFFVKTKTIKIGLAFDEQEVDEIDIDDYYIPLAIIITPTRTIRRMN